MSWANDKNTLICEECGHEGRPEEFIWVLNELPICQNGAACHRRQDTAQWVEARQNIKARKGPSRFNKLITKRNSK